MLVAANLRFFVIEAKFFLFVLQINILVITAVGMDRL